MATYAWEGRTASGEVRKGTVNGESDQAATAQLRAQNITVTKLQRREGGFKLKFPKIPGIGGGVSGKDLAVFARQFATMIDSGLPLVQCLDILASQSPNRNFGKVLFDVKERVEGGSNFSDGLRSHPKVFDPLFVNLIHAGEIGGILDTILNRIATYLEKAKKLKDKVKAAMFYPIAISVVAIVVVVILLWKVIPVFAKMFKDMGAGELPALTRIVIDSSDWFVANGVAVVLVTVAAGFGLRAAVKTKRGNQIKDTIILKMPILGPVMRKVVIARFTRTFGTLIASGVPILDAMEITAKSSGNSVIEAALMDAREKISEGKDLGTPLKESGVFPAMVIQMITVGEQTGAMDQMLQKIADFYEDEVDTAVDGLTKLMEPMMMVVLGGIVGFILIAMYLPIFELGGAIKG